MHLPSDKIVLLAGDLFRVLLSGDDLLTEVEQALGNNVRKTKDVLAGVLLVDVGPCSAEAGALGSTAIPLVGGSEPGVGAVVRKLVEHVLVDGWRRLADTKGVARDHVLVRHLQVGVAEVAFHTLLVTVGQTPHGEAVVSQELPERWELRSGLKLQPLAAQEVQIVLGGKRLRVLDTGVVERSVEGCSEDLPRGLVVSDLREVRKVSLTRRPPRVEKQLDVDVVLQQPVPESCGDGVEHHVVANTGPDDIKNNVWHFFSSFLLFAGGAG